jgi:hypothetical protein
MKKLTCLLCTFPATNMILAITTDLDYTRKKFRHKKPSIEKRKRGFGLVAPFRDRLPTNDRWMPIGEAILRPSVIVPNIYPIIPALL